MLEFKLESSEESAEEFKSFITSLPQGGEALLKGGCDPLFARALTKAVEEKNCAFVIRGSEPIQPWEREQVYIPKPTWLHAKRSNIDHMKGAIPSRQFIHALGRAVDGKIVETTLHDIPDEKGVHPPTKPLVEPLEVFIAPEDIQPPDHTIIPSSNDKEILHVANDVPLIDGKPVLFKLNLEEKNHSGSGYKLYIQIPPNTTFQAAEKLGMRDKNQTLLVVGRDHDLGTIEPSITTIRSAGTPTGIPSIALETVNTFASGGRVNMIRGLHALNPDEGLPPQSSVVQYGCATSYEGGLSATINQEFNKIHPTISNPVQHGPENHNPGKPSNINTTMVHVFKNTAGRVQIVLTRNEEEFARLAKARVSSNYLEVHPKWNMKHWASVIEKQLLTGYSINAETMLNYLAYKTEKEIPTSSIEARKVFIDELLTENITLHGLTFNPLDRIFISPVHDMELWALTAQKQLERVKALPSEQRNLGGTLRPLALLTYYQHQFNVIDIHANGNKEQANDLKINYHLFESDIVNEVLKDENHIKTTFIHPEFNLTKWLPVFIKQLELKISGKPMDHVIDPSTRGAFCKQLEKFATKQRDYNVGKLSELRSGVKDDKYLSEQLIKMNTALSRSRTPPPLSLQESDKGRTKFITTASGKELVYGSEVSPPKPFSNERRSSAPFVLGRISLFTSKHPEKSDDHSPKEIKIKTPGK